MSNLIVIIEVWRRSKSKATFAVVSSWFNYVDFDVWYWDLFQVESTCICIINLGSCYVCYCGWYLFANTCVCLANV